MTFHTSTARNFIVDLVLEWPMGGYICVPMGGYVWLWVPIYCVVLCSYGGYGCLCVAMSSYVWLCVYMCECVAICGYV